MQEDTSFRGDVIGLCISIKGRQGKTGEDTNGVNFQHSRLLKLRIESCIHDVNN